MIYGNQNQLSDYGFLEDQIQACFDYAKKNPLEKWEAGSYEIDGKCLFVNIVEYATTTPENRFWEAHRQYLDLHLMLLGEEQIDLNFIDDMEQKEYVEKDDFLPLVGEKKASIILNDGDFLICYPKDAHRTAVQVGVSQTIKKAIFKIQI